MSSIKALDIYDVIKPLHLYSRIIGLTSFSIRKEHGTYKGFISVFNVLCLISLSALCCCVIIILFYERDLLFQSSPFFASQVYKKSLVSIAIGNASLTLFSNVWFVCLTSRFTAILNGIKEIDDNLGEFGVHINNFRCRNFIYGFIFLTIFLTLSFFGFGVWISYTSGAYKESLRYIATDIYTVQCFITLGSHFTFIIWAIKLRYRKINQILMTHFPSLDSSQHVTGKILKLNKAAIMHDKLVDITENISYCYGVPVSFNFIFLWKYFFLYTMKWNFLNLFLFADHVFLHDIIRLHNPLLIHGV